MEQVLGIGIQDFERIRETNNFYIDKTDFIKEWWEANNEVTLITRPRRFGKTLNMRMLNCFLSNQYENRGDLFEGLSIWKYEKFRQLQGTYPVIYMTFAGIKPESYSSFLFQMRDLAAKLYFNHRCLLESRTLTKGQKEIFVKIMDRESDPNDLQLSVNTLSMYLQVCFGQKAVIILDEYDTPMQEAYIHGYWSEMVQFMRGFFNLSFKTNPYMERVIMTGITRVSRESIFSDFNNLVVVTTTSEKFETAFGFTEKEVFGALEQYGLEDKKREVKAWYDGFKFGRVSDIYNPWSIINYLQERKLKTYWVNSSSNGLVNELIRKGGPDLKQKMEQILKGEELEVQLDEQVVFNQLDENEDAVWSLLVATGYLKITDVKWTGKKDNCILKITNLETEIMFESMIQGWFQKGRVYNSFVKALLSGDLKEMNAYMNLIALQTFSSFDSGNEVSEFTQPERFYHGFVLGLLIELRERYEIKSNRESGFGRYDTALIPLNGNDPAIIIEFKVFDSTEENSLQETVQSALTQISEKNYDADLLTRGIKKERIYHYGFAFSGKKVLIGR